MIDELYDSVLSITNQTGYLDKISELEDKKSLLKWSSNNIFPHSNYKIYNPNYPTKVFSYDNHFRAPFSTIIKEDGTLH
jgi:hypothetical protein